MLQGKPAGSASGSVVARLFDTSADPKDFAPALLRIQDQPPSPFSGLLLKIMLVFFVCLVLWAAFARLDIVAVANGKLVPQSYLRIVQSTEQGIVKEILVRDGQAVREGQVLIRMDTRLSNADRHVVDKDLKLRQLQLRRIDTELADGGEITRAPGDDPDLYAQVEAQFKARRQAYRDAYDTERATLAKAHQDLKTALEVEGKLKQTVPLYREQAEGWDKLAKEGFAGKLMAQERARQYIENAQDLRTQVENIAGLRVLIEQQTKRMAQITSNYRQQLQIDRVDHAANAHRLRQELDKHEHRAGLMELKAPDAGIVKDLATHTIGTVTQPGTVLLTVVPQGEPLVAEVWVANDDVGFVRAGQPVKLKLATFQFQKYGMVQGSVRNVSADSSDNQNGAAQSPEQNARNRMPTPLTYKTIVETKAQTLLAQGVNYPLAPGMQVAAEIHLGSRSVLEYLFSPLTKAFHEAGRER